MKWIGILAMCLWASIAGAQEAENAPAAAFRVLDKLTGDVQDIELQVGETRRVGLLTINLGECRFPTQNPTGDAYEFLTIFYQDRTEPVFRGWMIASSPAISAMEHPRYDVWALRCINS